MPKKMSLSQFEHSLVGLQGSILLYENSSERHLLFDFMFPSYQGYLSDVKNKLEEIEMYSDVENALKAAEILAREGKFEASSDVILEVNRALMRASGTWDKLAKRYSNNVLKFPDV